VQRLCRAVPRGFSNDEGLSKGYNRFISNSLRAITKQSVKTGPRTTIQQVPVSGDFCLMASNTTYFT